MKQLTSVSFYDGGFFSPALLFFQNGNRKIAEKKIHLTSKDLSAMAPSLSQDALVLPGALWVMEKSTPSLPYRHGVVSQPGCFPHSSVVSC